MPTKGREKYLVSVYTLNQPPVKFCPAKELEHLFCISMKWKFISLLLFSSLLSTAQLPWVYFNHAFLALDSTDYEAMRNNSFIKNELAGFQTRSTVSNGSAWTGSYMYGTDNYLELFKADTLQRDLGSAALATSVDNSGELIKVDTVLQRHYPATIEERQKKMGDKMVPWFNTIYINDTAFFEKSGINFWMMEYKAGYFDANKIAHKKGSVSREEYLTQFADSLKNKWLKRFTGITFNATPAEEKYLRELLLQCGLKPEGDHTLLAADNFAIHFKTRKPETIYGISKLEFETFAPHKRKVQVSENIKVIVSGDRGEILFE